MKLALGAATLFVLIAYPAFGQADLAPKVGPDADLNRAHDACMPHIKYVELPSGRSNRDGWQPGWEACDKIEKAWVDALKAREEDAQRDIINKVLPNLRSKP